MRNTLICTVGTSLFKPNLFGLLKPEYDYAVWLKTQPEGDRSHLSEQWTTHLRTALSQTLESKIDKQHWKPVADLLTALPGTTRLCGAEINSITDLIQRSYCSDRCHLVLCHSQTDEGEQIASILQHYYRNYHFSVQLKPILGLQDRHPKEFKTKGLRNLAKTVGEVVFEQGAMKCAINATGGYKAQIAIAVLMGQALSIPVYYKHEQFSEIIEFPPMPIGLDFSLWMEHSGLLTTLDRHELVSAQAVEENWDERLETLIQREQIDGIQYLELSPTGQIFHTTFKGRFESNLDQVLPGVIARAQKEPCRQLPPHNWGNAKPKILAFLNRIIDDCPYVKACRSHYWNPDLPTITQFRQQGEQIEGVFSNGSWTVKFVVETSATTIGQRLACIADLNQRLESWLKL